MNPHQEPQEVVAQEAPQEPAVVLTRGQKIDIRIAAQRRMLDLMDASCTVLGTVTVGKVQNKMARRLLRDLATQLRPLVQHGLRCVDGLVFQGKLTDQLTEELVELRNTWDRIRHTCTFPRQHMQAINNKMALGLLHEVSDKLTDLAVDGISDLDKLAHLYGPEGDADYAELAVGQSEHPGSDHESSEQAATQ